MLPHTLKNFNFFNDARSYLGVAEEIKLPALKRVTESYRGGGMNGPVKVDLGQDALELEFTCGGLVRQVFEQYGLAKTAGIGLRFAGAYQADDTGEFMAVEIVIRGRHEELDLGTAKGGDKSKMTVKCALSYYKLVINNQDVVEIDLLNFIETVGGQDRLAEQRQALGM